MLLTAQMRFKIGRLVMQQSAVFAVIQSETEIRSVAARAYSTSEYMKLSLIRAVLLIWYT